MSIKEIVQAGFVQKHSCSCGGVLKYSMQRAGSNNWLIIYPNRGQYEVRQGSRTGVILNKGKLTDVNTAITTYF